MDLSFLGGASTVTGSRFLLQTERATVLIDCGMFQGGPNEQMRNRIPLGFDPKALDAILVTHAHLDHCGLLPVAVKHGYAGPIYLTGATAELVTLVLLDSGRLQEEFAKRQDRWARRDPARHATEEQKAADTFHVVLETAHGNGDDTTVVDHDVEAELRAQPAEIESILEEPLYTTVEAAAVPPLFRSVKYDAEREVAPGVHATFLDAGHILGSAMIRLRIQEREGGPERTIVFSGDLGRPGTPILRDPTVLSLADYVCVESTYGGREHDPEAEAVQALADAVTEVAKSNGVLLVPSFAIGRTQEIVWELDRLIDAGKIPLLPLYLDSPMASKASDIYRRHPETYDAETKALLDKGGSPLDYPDQRITNDVRESMAISRTARPYMIVASNGMLTGGRVVSHLRDLIGDPVATILFVGYQGVGTLGSHLQAGATTVKIDGAVHQVRCRIRSISGFSAHADESELLDWLRNFGAGKKAGDAGFPKTVFLVHGDPEAQQAMEPKVAALGFTTHVPHWRERVTLD